MALAQRHAEYALGFQDETWWSRVKQPNLHAWVDEGAALRLVAQTKAKDGRPISAITILYLSWCCEQLAQHGKQALLMIWDNASWHVSQEVHVWIRTHNQEVRRQGRGVRIVPCLLPTKSPWLNRIEPHWVHGKRGVVEPARLLTAQELTDRVWAYFGCAHEPHLTVTEKVA
jgi:hypothetical protein